MGQMFAVNKLPKKIRIKIEEMINDPAMSQAKIVEAINREAGKQLISKSSLCRFIQGREKLSGRKRGETSPTAEESLSKIATALERIAFFMEKQYNKKYG
jgi:hypothetical protein